MGWIAYERPMLPTIITSFAYAFTLPMAFPWDDIPLDVGVWRYEPPAWANDRAFSDSGSIIVGLILLAGTVFPALVAALSARVVRRVVIRT